MSTRTVKRPSTKPELPPLPEAPPAPPSVMPELPPAPAPPAVTAPPSPPPELRRPARPWPWIAGAIGLVVAVIGGVLLWTSGDEEPGPPPVSAAVAIPTALRELGHTATSVDIRWRPGGSRSQVDIFVVLRDGAEIDTVPGQTLQFGDTGLLPDTPYAYQVVAVEAGVRSQPSAPIQVRTDRASLGSALLDGLWSVRMRITSAFNFQTISEGKRDSADWMFKPRGDGVRVLGSPFQIGSFNMMLRGKGTSLSGTSQERISQCLTTQVTDTLTLRIRITKGAVRDGAWRAVRWTGTLQDASPPASSGLFSCGASGYTAALVGRPA